MRNNYIIARDNAQQLFLKMNQAELIHLHALYADNEYIYIDYFGETYAISRRDGRITLGGTQAGFNTTLAIFDYLSHAPTQSAGKWCATNSLPHVGQSQPSGSKLYAAYAEKFQDRADALSAALNRLKCADFPKGDVSGIIPVFSDVHMVFEFWAADEDFPPQIGFFWDENVLTRLRYETLYYVMGDFLEMLNQMSQRNS